MKYLVHKNDYEKNRLEYIVVMNDHGYSKYVPTFMGRGASTGLQRNPSLDFYLGVLGYIEIPEAEAVLLLS